VDIVRSSLRRNDALDRYVFEKRTGLVGGPHVQCLDVWETVHRRKVRSTLFKTHFENRLASAKDALQRVVSLSSSNGGLSVSRKSRIEGRKRTVA
jgi:hypothetical protein